ncbi:MAG: 5-formyltetrahydrofolate cyclo-ligase [Oscillospiraceae bacterium]
MYRDIREYKKNLRAHYKELRRGFAPQDKLQRDRRIAARVRRLYQYRNAGTVLCYMSTPIEVDTLEFIERAWADGKRVAVPRCIENTRLMDFYYIRCMQDVAPRTFGVLEPIPERCEKVEDFSGSICLVPGLAFDRQGYRLGYGKGYYDRFLDRYPCPKIGIIYGECVQNRLIHGRFDVPVDLLVTQDYIRRTDLNKC